MNAASMDLHNSVVACDMLLYKTIYLLNDDDDDDDDDECTELHFAASLRHSCNVANL